MLADQIDLALKDLPRETFFDVDFNGKKRRVRAAVGLVWWETEREAIVDGRCLVGRNIEEEEEAFRFLAKYNVVDGIGTICMKRDPRV